MTMTNGRIQELASLNSLGALDGAEVQEFERLMANADDAMRKEIASWDATAAKLAHHVRPIVAPKASVKSNLMRAIAERHATERALEGPGNFKLENAQGISTLFTKKMEWLQHPVPGIRFKVLSENVKRNYVTMLMQVDPGTVFPEHHHTGDEECYVISGSFTLGDKRIGTGDFHHGDETSDHATIVCDEGCLLLLVVAKEDYIPPVE